ncbi:MAG: Uma2 family endonuclease [Proteobacteria bacterium]|nr:Uma2 family endonuclease [Pseudomonadota bacterium]
MHSASVRILDADEPENLDVQLATPLGQLPLLMRPAVPFTDNGLYQFCRANSELRIERTKSGDISIMPPTGGETGRRNFILLGRFFVWVEADGSGIAFDSSTGFVLPNSAVRAPDISWVERSRWEALSPRQRSKFLPLCPDFAVELRSASDTLAEVQEKCAEYIANGARLVWLIDPIEKRVHIYCGGAVDLLDGPGELSGEPVLKGLRINLRDILD